MNQQKYTLEENAVLALTKTGERELHEAGTALTKQQLEVLVLVDDPVHVTVAQMMARTRNLAPQVVLACLSELIDKNYISITADTVSDALDPGDFFSLKSAIHTVTEAGEQHNSRADADAEVLRRKGYCVNMARRPTMKRKHDAGRKLVVLVVDDDPDICRVLELYLKLEGFEPRIAMNRDEIVAALRSMTLPDMVLLDVVLGAGLNGFDILARMRQHPLLKELPVIMLTAEATREAVLKGILGGADGYVTKPFEIHPLVRAIKIVLDLKVDGNAEDWDYSL